MGWGRIDDHFDDHPKVLAILDEEDVAAAAMAIATWTLCFSWAHRNTRKRGKTPGLLPVGLPRRYFGREARDGVDLLVKHGLWHEHDSGGWLIHDFDDYLPTAETREVRSEAGKRGAAKRWAAKHAAEGIKSPADGNLPSPHGNEPSGDGNEPSGSWQTDSNGLADAWQDDGKPVANDGSRAPARRDPTPIPVPEEPQKLASLASSGRASRSTRRGTRIPDDFTVTPEMVAWARENVPHVDGRRETTKFVNYWQAKPGRDATKIDWPATWRNWMLNAADRAGPPPATAASAPLPAAQRCPEHPSYRKGHCSACRSMTLASGNGARDPTPTGDTNAPAQREIGRTA